MKRTLRAGLLLGLLSLAAPAYGQSPLKGAVERIAAEAGWRSPGTVLSVAVLDLSTGESAEHRAEEPHVSASAAKPMWMAAALHGRGLAAVEPFAEAVLGASDNHAAGQVIDLIGADAVNRYLREVAGLRQTALTRWRYGNPKRTASNSPRRLGDDNYFTARDVVTFLAALERGTLLAGPGGQALRRWMLTSPRSGLGGWLGSRLPPAARASMQQKSGWLGPGCCSSDARYNTLNTLGVVSTARGRYAVALLARSGRDFWGRQVRLVEWAACVIHQAAAREPDAGCGRPGDPARPR